MLKAFVKVFLLVTSVHGACAQATPKTLLWRVTGNGVELPSHVFGTMHSRDNRAFRFSDSLWVAMESAAVVAGELDLEQGRQNALQLMGAMMLPDGKRLEDLYKKKDWLIVEAELKERLGIMAAMVHRMKPFFVMAMLTEASMESDEELVLDDHILSTARAQGKRVIGIETLAEQMTAMDILSLKEQSQMLLEHVKSGGHTEELEAMMDAYEAQDLDALIAITEQSSSMPKALEKALITDRNHRMVHRLDSIMQGGENIFFAVGAAHMPKPEGVLELLRKKGYAVEPVMFQAVTEEPLEPEIEDNDR